MDRRRMFAFAMTVEADAVTGEPLIREFNCVPLPCPLADYGPFESDEEMVFELHIIEAHCSSEDRTAH